MSTAPQDKLEHIPQKIDIKTDVKHPLVFPWPYADESVKEVSCVGVLEYIPGKLRGEFMDEIYRILIPGGVLQVGVLYWNSSLAYHDYRFEWPPLAEQSFLMFNKDWRRENQKDVDIVADFDF